MTPFTITLIILACITPASFAASYGKDTRNKHAQKSPCRSLSGSLGSPSRSIASDIQEILDLFDENKCKAGCKALEMLLNQRLLTSAELAHLRSACKKQSDELFEKIRTLQGERSIIDDLSNKRAHVKIEGLDAIIQAQLAHFSPLSLAEIDHLTSELEESEHEDIKEKAAKARIALATALIEQERTRQRHEAIKTS
jgi:hypothetical protein